MIGDVAKRKKKKKTEQDKGHHHEFWGENELWF